jgi:hypothetical protein
VNLSFSEQEYQYLSQIAAAQGKLVTTMLTDAIKIMIYQTAQGGPKAAQEQEKDPRQGDLVDEVQKSPKTRLNKRRGGS